MARPDVFSVRHTTVEDYLRPMVHEVKVSRADLLSDLRHAAKRECYRWLSCETYYVFPSGMADPREVPEAFGVWLLNGRVDSGTLELARPALHQPCKLHFMVWMALAKATPVRADDATAQRELSALLGAGFDVQTPATRSQQAAAMVAGYTTMVNVSSVSALFIGLFIIYNSVQISVVRRPVAEASVWVLPYIGSTCSRMKSSMKPRERPDAVASA